MVYCSLSGTTHSLAKALAKELPADDEELQADQDAERYLHVGRLFPHQPKVMLCMLV